MNRKIIILIILVVVLAISAFGKRSEDPVSESVIVESNAKSYKDIPYVERAGFDQSLTSLDIYAEESLATASLKPVIVMIHGGGWRRGDKKTNDVVSPKTSHYASKGYVFISINYRLTEDDRVRYPMNVQDVASAIAWINKNAATYGGDGNNITIMGHSAGGHLAALVATDQSFLRAEGVAPSIIKGVITLDTGLLDLTDARPRSGPDMLINQYTGNNLATNAKASIFSHVAPSKYIPPFLFLYATKNGEGRSDIQGKELANLLIKNGYKAEAVGISGKNHNEMNADVGIVGDSLTEEIDMFLGK